MDAEEYYGIVLHEDDVIRISHEPETSGDITIRLNGEVAGCIQGGFVSDACTVIIPFKQIHQKFSDLNKATDFVLQSLSEDDFDELAEYEPSESD